MPTLTASEIADLVSSTQKDLGRLKWTDLSSDLQYHTAMPKLLKKNRVGFQSGYAIQWNVMVKHSGAARNVGMYAEDVTNVGDVLQQATIPWRHCTTNYSFDRKEIKMNRAPARIVELIKVRRADAMVSMAELCEENFWNKPTNSTDEVKPFGVPYWIVKNSTAGFTGGDPSGFSAGAGGIATGTYPRWKNYSCNYTTVNEADFITKVRKAATFTKFKPPVPMPQYANSPADMKYGYYTNYDVVGTLESILTTQNSNLGNDIASKDGELIFRRVPVTWVPYLEDDTSDPFYGINWSAFRPVFLIGEYMEEEPPEKSHVQHTVFNVFIDMTVNFQCTNRRLNFVAYK